MQKLVKSGKNTEINKQSNVKFWLNRIRNGAVSYSLSCKKCCHRWWIFYRFHRNFLFFFNSLQWIWMCLKLCQNKACQTFVEMLVFWILFLNLNRLPAEKKGFKKCPKQQIVGPSYFVRALVRTRVNYLIVDF